MLTYRLKKGVKKGCTSVVVLEPRLGVDASEVVSLGVTMPGMSEEAGEPGSPGVTLSTT